MRYIVRRIDDIGRIHIAKEIRRSLDIKEGDPLKITLVGNGILITKYNPEIDSDTDNEPC